MATAAPDACPEPVEVALLLLIGGHVGHAVQHAAHVDYSSKLRLSETAVSGGSDAYVKHIDQLVLFLYLHTQRRYLIAGTAFGLHAVDQVLL